jgi:hypothetical protein
MNLLVKCFIVVISIHLNGCYIVTRCKGDLKAEKQSISLDKINSLYLEVDYSSEVIGQKKTLSSSSSENKLKKNTIKFYEKSISGILKENNVLIIDDEKASSHKIKFHIHNYGEFSEAKKSAIISVFTFYLFPSSVTDNFRITCSLYDVNGKEIYFEKKEYCTKSWFNLLFLPLFPFQGIKTRNIHNSKFTEILKNIEKENF